MVSSEARDLAEEWTYRYLAAATHGPTPNSPSPKEQRRLGQTGDGNGSRRAGADNQRIREWQAAKESPCPIVAGFAPTSGKHRRPATATIPSVTDHENNQIRSVAKPPSMSASTFASSSARS
jgi:hypothetical protein